MYTLFIDTHSEIIRIALVNNDEVIFKEVESIQNHSVLFLPLIQNTLIENNISIKQIKKIVAVNGPGSFTGIRIGLSVAKTMAYSLNIPIVTISSLTMFLISSEINDNKMAIIEDNKGFYISVFDKDNNVLIEECYVTEIEEYKNKYKVVENNVDIKKVVEFSEKLKEENCHFVKANYVKTIEVMNDKR